MSETDDGAVFPDSLQPGDTIGIAAPGSRPDPDKLKRGKQVLRNRGYQLKPAENVDRTSGFSAGEPELRCRATLRLFEDRSVDAVFCARGGNGAVHLLDRFLDGFEPSHPKPFVGYSDITLLQIGLFASRRYVTFSGPMVATEFGTNSLTQPAEKQFWNMLTSPPRDWSLSLPGDRLTAWRDGSASGPLLGGCLSLFRTLLGTPYFPNVRDAVLVLEDVDEEPHKIDRMFHHLRLASVFERIGGLVLGGFDTCFPDAHTGPSLREIVLDAVPDGTDLPIVGRFPYGHRVSSFRTLPFGAPVVLETDPPHLELNRP